MGEENSRHSHARKVATVLGLTLVLLVVAAEVTIKLYFFGWYDSPKWLLAPSENPKLVYELSPDIEITATYLTPRQRDWKYHASINAQGFRGTPATPKKDKPRVIVIGDSTAFGLGVSDDETFPVVLERALKGRVEVLNWGVPGYNLVQAVELFREKGQVYEPDVVVYALNYNDFEPLAIESATVVRYTRLSNIYSIYRHLKFLSGEDYYVRLDRDRGQRIRAAMEAFDAFLGLAREWGFTPLVFQASCAFGTDGPQIGELFRHAAAAGVATVTGEPEYCIHEYQIPEDWHPTAEGQKLLGQSLVRHVESIVKTRNLSEKHRSSRIRSSAQLELPRR